jgi:formylglycine-generating enzyme required for sulfatase activity
MDVGTPPSSHAASPLSVAEERALQPQDTFKECHDCPEMLVVPPGSFMMGSPESEPERESWQKGTESPQIKVTVARPFAAAKFSVTRGEFAKFVNQTGYEIEDGCYAYSGSEWRLQRTLSWRSPGFTQDDQHPVVCVNWDDAKAYVAWLSHKTGATYRLLSEAEREYVTRAGTTTPFWWGTSITPRQANYNGNSTYAGGGLAGEYRRRTVPVDSFEANPFGLYNVHGNVWEWTEDCWNESNADNPANGSARVTGDCSHRVVRGGSWGSLAWRLRAAVRGWDSTDVRDYFYGFRVARKLKPWPL